MRRRPAFAVVPLLVLRSLLRAAVRRGVLRMTGHGWRVRRNLEHLERLAVALDLDLTFDHVGGCYVLDDGEHRSVHDNVWDAEARMGRWLEWISDDDATGAAVEDDG